MRGLVNAVLFSLPFWAAIVLVWWLYPPTSMEHITVYSGLIAVVVFVMVAFIFDRPRPVDPPCPDLYFNAFSPLPDDAHSRWEDDH